MKEARAASDELINLLTRSKGVPPKLPNQTILTVLHASKELFEKEPNILDLRTPINVVGDIHGQFPDLMTIFQDGEFPPNSRYLFLGDYVDRGTQSLEVICLLLALKVRYPNHMFLLRGNHETKEMTEEYGFAVECSSKQNKATYSEFISVFDTLPLAAIINNSYFCVHGGLTPDLHELSQIRALPRPTQIQEHGFLADLVWSDPDRDFEEFAPSERGLTVKWGFKPAQQFMEANNLTKIIRAHQMAEEGIEYPFSPENSVITVFSAPWYAGEFKNKGGFLKIDKNNNIEPIIINHNDKAPPVTFAQPTQNKNEGKGRGKGGKDGKKGKRK
ncbi:Ser/Thr protein phosphatase, putative [Trichomonas vaginalis G3]|uniref:Serine/threonine-protein phosphatase n=1 Tax=Trichomonas vaginalis (strain ATCC PRA-98 / G3) TaxID=412133 RepID=A2D8Z4_TRIV3|nr:phosphoprotein phosphatase protein [Trichomonas vaginalis G3]EAY23020.1 Ser/Thr protein phosphatase, putative [Trichomonas vaginalis G3]KAI5518983.1 phosphoprotein phosphatase protein [Trichomonas vaginalis G3]|eukprot:XP_001584006.1 Ser/Thr protein phosphatase [Trichomonas vaginalis G3]